MPEDKQASMTFPSRMTDKVLEQLHGFILLNRNDLQILNCAMQICVSLNSFGRCDFKTGVVIVQFASHG
jgi:hypothetical protein